MPEEKKTEEQLRHDIRREFSFSEERDKEKVDSVLELKKKRYDETRKKNELKAKVDELEKSGKPQGENKEPQGNQETQLSVKDSAFLQESKIPVDDWDDVLDYVKYKKQSDKDFDIKKALGSSVLKAELAAKAEERTASNAAHTKKGRGGSSKPDGQALLKQAEKTGEIPESDEEIDAMLDAEWENKSKN
ncbi:hypothetical protein KKF61_07515 [Patescibacteria group bacterium]|nr:hypothetical protein [Patescibacteria group bacterium]